MEKVQVFVTFVNQKILDKTFNNGLSKTCGRQPLKYLPI